MAQEKSGQRLGPTPRILIIVANICNYSVNSALCRSKQQDVERKEENVGPQGTSQKLESRGFGALKQH